MLILTLVCAGATPSAAQDAPAPPVRQPASIADLEMPVDASRAAVFAARPNLTRWRDRNVGATIPELNGYFAVLGDRSLPGGVVRAAGRLTGGELEFNGAYVQPYEVCGVAVAPLNPTLYEVVFLGETWRADFAALDAELGGPPEARRQLGRPLPEGVAAPAWVIAPSGSDFVRFYPTRALQRSLEGSVELACLVQADLSLRCAVRAEEPVGFGFGAAALRVFNAPSLRLAPTTSTGESSIGLCIPRRVNFRTG